MTDLLTMANAQAKADAERIKELEEERDKAIQERDIWRDLVRDEIGENIKLFEALGVSSKVADDEEMCTAAICLAAALELRTNRDELEAKLADAHCLLRSAHAAVDPEAWPEVSVALAAALGSCELPHCQHLAQAEAKIAAVVALHVPDTSYFEPGFCRECRYKLPCDTLKAIHE